MSENLAVVKKEGNAILSVKNLLNNESVKKRFENVLGQKAAGFMASIINTVNSNTELQKVDANSVIMSALVAATLDLPIDKNLGFAHIVPYNVKEGTNFIKKAQFQLGYKGFIQLAMRTGQYKTINATEIYEGELVKHSRLKGEVEIDEDKRISDKIIGYAAYFSLINGFEKTLYMSIDELRGHGQKYSKTFNNDKGQWKQNEQAMCLKTVLKLLLSKYGILSIEMQSALKTDQAVINSDNLNDDNAVSYIDNPNFREIKVEESTGEVIDITELPECLK